MPATTPEFTLPLYIRAAHPDAFRSGQWAKVMSVDYMPERHGPNPRSGRPVYLVQFVDGVRDQWPVYDEVAGYEFTNYVSS